MLRKESTILRKNKIRMQSFGEVAVAHSHQLEIRKPLKKERFSRLKTIKQLTYRIFHCDFVIGCETGNTRATQKEKISQRKTEIFLASKQSNKQVSPFARHDVMILLRLQNWKHKQSYILEGAENFFDTKKHTFL